MTYDFPDGTIGYSLVRFSTPGQADGDSFRRQDSMAESFTDTNKIPLDRSLHESDIRKLAFSAFKGEHVIKGPLRRFFAGIESGSVRPGLSVLLVGEWNRLTRQISTDALKLVIALMDAGIGIVDLQDGAYYTRDRLNSEPGLLIGLTGSGLIGYHL